MILRILKRYSMILLNIFCDVLQLIILINLQIIERLYLIIKKKKRRNLEKNRRRMNCYIYNIYKKINLVKILFNNKNNFCFLTLLLHTKKFNYI
jgi:uncharacterized membrane protein SpoIIM required for sporulation